MALLSNVKEEIIIHCYVKILSLLPSILGRSTASTRPMYIYMGIAVLLLHFQKPATRKNCNNIN